MPDMTTPKFTDADLLDVLRQLQDDELDGMDFGVIGIDAASVVRRYNAWESRMAGLSPQRVLGHPLFTVVAPCMNNALVAQRFVDATTAALPLDDTLDYVLSLRMRPVKVQLRLLSRPGEGMRYVLVQRPQAS
mgnify:FL=1